MDRGAGSGVGSGGRAKKTLYVGAQGMAWIAMAAGAAFDALFIPGCHVIEQAHGALMGDVLRDPCMVQPGGYQHGVTAMARRVSSR